MGAQYGARDMGGAMQDFSNTAALPSQLPIFPLKGAILLPQTQLPLTIFEPRYLAMVRDVMAGAQIIGMVQPQPVSVERAAAYTGSEFTPPVFRVGGAGRIVECAQTKDGRYLITLSGIGRFAIIEEVKVSTAYRQVHADYTAYIDDGAQATRIPAQEREALLAELKIYLDAQDMAADWAVVRAARDEVLINTLAMLCPFDVSEKQALLEAENIAERLGLMRTLMAFARQSSLKEQFPARH
jgi:uncharacterized protein